MRSPQRLKTPKPRRVGQQFVETPGRDELIFSQHFDSQALVGWDCNSPDVLRRISKETDGSDVTDLLKLIGNDDECVDEARPSNRSTPPLLGVWREGGGGEPNNNNSSNIPSRQHRKGRFRKRSGKDSAVSRDLFEKLSLELEKCTEVTHETEEVAEKNQEEGMQPGANTSSDLFDSAKSEHTKTLTADITGPVLAINKACTNEKQPTRISPRLLRKKESLQSLGDLSEAYNSVEKSIAVGGLNDVSKGVLNKQNVNVGSKVGSKESSLDATKVVAMCSELNDAVVGRKGSSKELSFDATKVAATCSELNDALGVHSDEDWSDDDLFEEDSFIIKATQLPARDRTPTVFRLKRKSSNAGEVPKSKVSRYSFQLEDKKAAASSTNLSSNRFTALQSMTKTASAVLASSSSKPNAVTQSHASSVVSSKAGVVISRTVAKPAISKPSALPHSIIKINDSVLASPRPAQNFYSNRGNQSTVTRSESRTVRNLSSQIGNTTSSSTSVTHTGVTYSGVTHTGQSISNKASTYNTVHPCSTIWPTTNSHQALNAQSLLNRSNSFKKHNSFTATDKDSSAAQNARRRSISGGDNSYPNNSAGVGTRMSYPLNTNPPCQTYTAQKAGILNNTQSRFQNKTNVQSRIAGNVSVFNSINSSSISSFSSAIASSPQNKDLTVMNSSLLNSTFDTSLSDELLCTLAEPDEFLDSQPNTKHVGAVKGHVTTSKTLTTAEASVASLTGSVCPNTGASTTCAYTTKQISHSTTTTSTTSASASNTVTQVTGRPHTVASTSHSALIHKKAVKGASSTNTGAQPRQFRFSQRQGPPAASKTGGCETVTSTATVPSFAVPVNTVGPAKPYNVQAALNQCSEDLFDDDDDHMLLSDDGLTEPQVLALLDEVEFQATQQLSRQSKAVSSKTSNQGIEIDAGEPTNQDQGYGSSQEFPNSQGGINNSQGGNTNSQEKNSYNQGVNSNSQGHVGEGVTSNSQSGANGNDGVRSTQTKYSPAEIEKKKQLALQKRLQRQNVHS
ncbi:serine-rich adhesin for platelets-like isoform X2 [Dreissena polymorpha]|nr:serine-rich adhesin for platelets-like isoform X2 [Dreissena polymorpha]